MRQWNSSVLRVMNLQIFNSVSALDDTDYTNTSMDISFPEGSMDGDTRCINVSIADDLALEEEETFTVSLTVTSGDIVMGNTTTIITIIDNEGLQ